MKILRSISAFFVLLSLSAIYCGCSGKKDGKAAEGYEVKYGFDRGGTEAVDCRARVKGAEATLAQATKPTPPAVAWGPADIKKAKDDVQKAQKALSAALQKKKWLFFVTVTVKGHSAKLMELLTVRDSDGKEINIQSIGLPSKGEEVIGGDNIYTDKQDDPGLGSFNGLEIEDLGNGTFLVGKNQFNPGKTIKVDSMTLTIATIEDALHHDSKDDMKDTIYEAKIQLPPKE